MTFVRIISNICLWKSKHYGYINSRLIIIFLKVVFSPSKKIALFISMEVLEKWWKILFVFHSQDIKIFVLDFGLVGKTILLERYGLFQILWHRNLLNKQLQYTYCPISHDVKAIRIWNLVSYSNKAREMFPFKTHAQNEPGRLVPDLFLFFKKALYEVKAGGLHLSFNIFR